MKKLSTDALTGGCLCGAVRYRTGPPMLPATICHCTWCRLAAGAHTVGLYTVEKATVAFTHGRPVEYRSSPRFCGRVPGARQRELVFLSQSCTKLDRAATF